MNTEIQQYIRTYEVLKKHLKWKVTDKRILMTISTMYYQNNKDLEINKFLDIAEKIKEQSGIFSPLHSYFRFTTAAMLDVKFENPESKIQTLMDYYEAFRKQKFASGIFTYISATILLGSGQEDPTSSIQKAMEIYKGMRGEHAFLTSYSDYPLATLLALENQPDIIRHIEGFYEELHKNGFHKGNDLQFLSHILALEKEVSRNELISRTVQVMDSFTGAGLRAKTIYYPIIGMLALLPPKDFSMDSILSVYEELNQQKDFKWQKNENIILATSFFVHDKLENQQIMETSLNTLLETVLQAQQAVMIASLSAAAAASASSSGN